MLYVANIWRIVASPLKEYIPPNPDLFLFSFSFFKQSTLASFLEPKQCINVLNVHVIDQSWVFLCVCYPLNPQIWNFITVLD